MASAFRRMARRHTDRQRALLITLSLTNNFKRKGVAMNKVVITLLVVSVAGNIFQFANIGLDQAVSTAKGAKIVSDDLEAANNLHQIATQGFRVNWVNCSYNARAGETDQLSDINATTEPWFSAVDGGEVDGYLSKTFYGASGLKPRSSVNLHLECNRANFGMAGACRVQTSKTEDALQGSFEPQN